MPPRTNARKEPAHAVPFADPEAEYAVLGAALLSPESLVTSLAKLEPTDFHDPELAKLWKSLRRIHDAGSPVDLLTGISAAAEDGVDRERAKHLLVAAQDSVTTPATSAFYTDVILAHSARRRALETMQRSAIAIRQSRPAELDDALQKLYADLETIRNRHDVQPIRETIHEVIERAQAAKDQKSEPDLKTGIRAVDNILGSLRREELVVVAARPSVGKTAFAMTVAGHAALRQGARVLVFSLEVPRHVVVRQMMAREASVDTWRMRNGSLSPDDWNRVVNDAGARIAESDLTIDDTPGLTAAQIVGRAQSHAMRKPLDLVIVDYLQLLGMPKHAESRQLAVAEMSTAMKNMARTLKTRVMALCQLNRMLEQRTDKRPMLSDLRDSGQIEQDCDVAILLHRPPMFEREDTATDHAAPTFKNGRPEPRKPPSDKREAFAIVAKQRDGPTGSADMWFIEQFVKFCDRF